MNPGDTIVACATPPGRSACALVRISGAGARAIARERLGIEVWEACARPCELRLWRARVAGREIEQSLPVRVIVSVGPRSYTGEDSLEIILPGNPALIERVIDALCGDAGVRRAGPGEFSARAYLNGKLTVERAEGVAASIGAGSEAELEAARRAMRGADAAAWSAWTDETATLLALVEAGIDFTDQEDVVAIATPALRDRAGVLADEIAGFLGGERATAEARHIARVVLAGRPNAGKSTLFNALVGRRRAVVWDQPGTTRDVLVERVDLSRMTPGGPEIELVDIAGLEAAGDGAVQGAIEQEMQRRAIGAIEGADVVVWCDPEGRFEGVGIGGELSEGRGTPVHVRTMADRVSARGGAGGDVGREFADVTPVCGLDGWNIDAVAGRIAEAVAVSGSARATGVGRALVARHRRALAEAEGILRGVVEGLKDGSRDDAAVASDLRSALDSLGSITGRLSPDEVMGLIFARFCVGK